MMQRRDPWLTPDGGGTVFSWLGGSGEFQAASKWSPKAVPGAADTVQFLVGGTVTGDGTVTSVGAILVEAAVSFSGPTAARDLSLQVGNGLTLQGGLLTLNSGSSVATSQPSGSGQPAASTRVDGGGTLVVAGGTLTADAGGLAVGSSGIGSFSITNYGTVSLATGQSNGAALDAGVTAGATASLVVDQGVLTTTEGDVVIGDNGVASLAVYVRGRLNLDSGYSGASDLAVGLNQGSNGILNLNGGYLTTTVGKDEIGVYGAGTLVISNGGYFSATESDPADWAAVGVGDASTGHGSIIVEGTASRMRVFAGGLVVGGEVSPTDGGSGSVTVEAGAHIQVFDTTTGIVLGTAGTGTLTATGAGSYLFDAGRLDIGLGNSGTFRVTAGAQVSIGESLDLANSAAILLGADGGVTGTATLSGVGTALYVNGQIDDGVSGTGRFTIGTGVSVISGDRSGRTASGVVLGYYAGSAGTLTVSGAGASLANYGKLIVGKGGAGTLTVSDGARIDSTNYATTQASGMLIGAVSGSHATALVTGTNSSLIDSTNLFVGYGGTGSLIVSSGAGVGIGAGLDQSSGPAAMLGYLSGGSGRISVTGAGSALAVDGELQIGVGGTGSLAASGGADLATGDTSGGTDHGLVVAVSAASTGTVTIAGFGTELTNSGRFILGDGGTGSMEIHQGAAVFTAIAAGLAEDALDIGLDAGSTGRLTVAGAASLLVIDGAVGIGTGGTGTLTASAGATVAASMVDGTITVGTGRVISTGAGSLIEGAALTVGHGVVTIADGGEIALSGQAQIGTGGTLSLAAGDLSATLLDLTGTVTGHGTIDAAEQDGTLTASGGTLEITGAVSGSTVLRIANNAALTLDGAVAAKATVDFLGATKATLVLGSAQAAKAGIRGFASGDTIDLANFAPSAGETVSFSENAAKTAGTLTVTDGSLSFKVTLFGQYLTGGFSLAGSGVTLLTYVTPPSRAVTLAASSG